MERQAEPVVHWETTRCIPQTTVPLPFGHENRLWVAGYVGQHMGEMGHCWLADLKGLILSVRLVESTYWALGLGSQLRGLDAVDLAS